MVYCVEKWPFFLLLSASIDFNQLLKVIQRVNTRHFEHMHTLMVKNVAATKKVRDRSDHDLHESVLQAHCYQALI